MTCGRDSVRCAAGRSQHVDTPACCLHHLHTVLRETVRILESHGIPYWADGGTLLGAVRDQAVIPWDTDADLGVMAADVPRVLGLAHAWEALGFEVQRHCGGALLRITYSPVNDMGVDLYPWAEDGDYLCHPFKGRVPRKWLLPFSRVRWDQLELAAPADAHRWLTARYGPDYMEPQRGVPARPGVVVLADAPPPPGFGGRRRGRGGFRGQRRRWGFSRARGRRRSYGGRRSRGQRRVFPRRRTTRL